MLRFTPSDNVEVLLRFEHGEANGDGPATQNHTHYSRDSHDFLVNDRGFFHNKWDSLTDEINVDVGYGEEVPITNIAARPRIKADTYSDPDGVTPKSERRRV